MKCNNTGKKVLNTLTETHSTHLDLGACSFEPALDIIIHALTVEKYRKAPSAAMRACRSAILKTI